MHKSIIAVQLSTFLILSLLSPSLAFAGGGDGSGGDGGVESASSLGTAGAYGIGTGAIGGYSGGGFGASGYSDGHGAGNEAGTSGTANSTTATTKKATTPKTTTYKAPITEPKPKTMNTPRTTEEDEDDEVALPEVTEAVPTSRPEDTEDDVAETENTEDNDEATESKTASLKSAEEAAAAHAASTAKSEVDDNAAEAEAADTSADPDNAADADTDAEAADTNDAADNSSTDTSTEGTSTGTSAAEGYGQAADSMAEAGISGIGDSSPDAEGSGQSGGTSAAEGYGQAAESMGKAGISGIGDSSPDAEGSGQSGGTSAAEGYGQAAESMGKAGISGIGDSSPDAEGSGTADTSDPSVEGPYGMDSPAYGNTVSVTDNEDSRETANVSVTMDVDVMGRLFSPVSLVDADPELSFMTIGRDEDDPTSVAGRVAVDPFSVETVSVDPTSVSTVDIGVVDAPTAPTNSFTGAVNAEDANISMVDVVSFTGTPGRADVSVSYAGQTVSISAATPAHYAAMGMLSISEADISALGKTIAGEVAASITGKIARGEELSEDEMAQIAVTVNAAVNRAFANTAVAFGPFNGSIAEAVTAGLTGKNAGQFSAFNDNSIDATEQSYSRDPEAFDAVAESFVNGKATEETSLSVTAAAAQATHYYNPTVAQPAWGNQLGEVETFGLAPHSHVAGKLGQEYSVTGQVDALDAASVEAYAAVEAAATTGLVSASMGTPAFSFSQTDENGTPTGNTISVDDEGYGTVSDENGRTVDTLSPEETAESFFGDGYSPSSTNDFSGNVRGIATSTTAHGTANAGKPYIPVHVVFDERNGVVELSRGEVRSASGKILDEQAPWGSNPTKPTLVVDADGTILFSDGTYAPKIFNGVRTNDDEYAYAYVIERVHDGVPVKARSNMGPLPGNFLTRAVSGLFANDDPFAIENVVSITYQYVDPDTSTADNEYHDYRIILDDQTERRVQVPVLTSFDQYVDLFADIGYEGDIFALVNRATEVARTETEPRPSIVSTLVTPLRNTLATFMAMITNGSSQEEQLTDFASLTPSTGYSQFTTEDVTSLTIYVGVPIECPDVGLVRGYVYAMTYEGYAEDGTLQEGMLAEPMCGDGGPRTYVTETALRIASLTGFEQLDVDQLLEIVEFKFADNGVRIHEASDDANANASQPHVRNATNEISFEVKITDTNNETVTDWTSSSVSIENDEQLHFRWDASEYARCLLFLADNGAYSLRRLSNLTMTTGNTESEGYNIFERTGPYRIECDGQMNGEGGVDTRTISVTVQ